MTEEEIRKLADRYVRENGITPTQAYYENKRILEADDVLPILRWLSDKFCIVEKEKVKNFLELSEVHALDSIDAVEFIEDIFGKELFNETEK